MKKSELQQIIKEEIHLNPIRVVKFVNPEHIIWKCFEVRLFVFMCVK